MPRIALHDVREGKKIAAVIESKEQVSHGVRQTLPANLALTSVVPDGQTVLVRNTNNAFSLVDLATMRETPMPILSQGLWRQIPSNLFARHDGTNQLQLLETTSGGPRYLPSVFVGPSSPELIAYTPQRKVLAWIDTATPHNLHSAKVDQQAKRADLDFGCRVTSIKFCADGRYLIGRGASTNGVIPTIITDLTSIDRITDQSLGQAEVIARDNHASVVAIGGDARPDEVWMQELFAHDRPGTRITQQGPLTGVAISPDGRTFAVSSEKGVLVLYDAEKQSRLATLHGHIGAIFSVAFSPDGRRLASASGLRETIKFWDVATRQELLTLPGEGTLLYSTAFASEGNIIIVSGTLRGTPIQYWRAPSWAEIEATEQTASRGSRNRLEPVARGMTPR